MIDYEVPVGTQLSRQLNEIALIAGRKRQSAQTGFVHHFYSLSEEEAHHTIPLVENACFALALLRSKTSEQMAEGKELLNRLLSFQLNDGNFPIYIHDYPIGKDLFLGVQLLPPFYYILEEFHTVLGPELKQRFHQAIRKLLEYALKAYQEKLLPYVIGLKIAAASKAFGTLFKDQALEKIGDTFLSEYLNKEFDYSWFSPNSIADICIALQMSYIHLQKSPWITFWQHLADSWHVHTCTYVGPGVKEYQQGMEPQPTLYDLFLGYFSQQFSKRALIEAPFHLLAVLIRPTEEALPPISYPLSKKGKLDQSSWMIYQEEKIAYSLIDKKALKNPAHENAFHPLCLFWGTPEKVHTFVCQNGNFETFNFQAEAKQIELNVQLSSQFVLEDREKSRELAFFFDIEPEAKMKIQGEAATTFQLGEELVLSTSQIQIALSINLIEGEGHFLGHLMKGNRPSQIQLKGANRYKAYDWQLFLRTLRRLEKCQLKVDLKLI